MRPGDADLLIFAPRTSRTFGEAVAKALETTLGEHEEREFDDGEHKIRPLVNVRGADVYVVASLYASPEGSVNDKLVRLLFLLGALRDGGAARLTAVLPYLCYARKDRRTQPRDPVTTRYMAQLLEAVGIDAVMALDVHNPAAFENAFRRRAENLEALPLFVEHFATRLEGRPPVVVSPDPGGIKRAERFRQALGRRLETDLDSAFMEKQRAHGRVTGEQLVGNVDGRDAVVLDDMIGTGHTLVRAARALRQAGARRVWAAATHGLFVGDAESILADQSLEQVVVTDSVPPQGLSPAFAGQRLTLLSAAPLVAEAIRRDHNGESLVELGVL